MGVEIVVGQKTLGDTVLLHQTLSNANDIDITVDGDVDEVYEFIMQGKIQNNGQDHWFFIRPNNANQTTNYFSNVHQAVGGNASAQNETLAGMLFFWSGGSGSYTTEGGSRAIFYAKSGWWRPCHIDYCGYVNSNVMVQMRRFALWKDSVTNITSFKLAWNAAPNSVSGLLSVRRLKVG